LSPSPRNILLLFAKFGVSGIGGVYSMLAMFERDLVGKYRWLTHEEFAEAVSIGHMSPGAPIINTGIFIAYRLCGGWGAAAAIAGLVVPGFVIVIGLGFAYLTYRDNPYSGPVLAGVGASVCGLLLSVVFRLSRSILKTRFDMALAVAGFGLMVFGRLNPIAILAGAGMAGLLWHNVYGKRSAA
jgi:chromate transporter